MHTILESSWLSPLGWALVHSLWQGAVLWAALTVVFALGRRRLRAAHKHLLAWMALFMLGLAPLPTLVWLQLPRATAPGVPSQNSEIPAPLPEPVLDNPATRPPVVRPTDALAVEQRAHERKGQIIQALAFAWLAGVGALTLRLLVGWAGIMVLRRSGKKPDDAWLTRFREWAKTAAVSGVQVRLAEKLGVPLVIGWLNPVICFPAALLSRLSVMEVQSLMLHELAHIKRRDPLLMLVVTVVETLFFHNPAAYMIARQVREQAELACDDLVVHWQGDRGTYARALAATEEWRGSGLVLASGGGALKHRIRHILGLAPEATATALPQRFGITGAAGVALYFLACGLGVPRLALALTPEERIQTITQEQAALALPTGKADPKPLTAEGTVQAVDGSPLPKSFGVMAWSQNYTSHSTNSPAGQYTVEGRGEHLFVGAWVRGFAPEAIPASPRNPATGKATFALKLEKGFPAVIRLADADGNVIPEGTVKVTARLPGGRDLYQQGELKTDRRGMCSPGHARSDQFFMVEVRVHGYQWNRFQNVRFQESTPTTLVLSKAVPVVGTIVDAESGKAVPGAKVLCMSHSLIHGHMGHGYSFSTAPEMSRSLSDENGKITLDVFHPEVLYNLLVEAPGYAMTLLNLSAQSKSFDLAMEREYVVAGVIEDPDKALSRDDEGKVYLSLDYGIDGYEQDIDLSNRFAVDKEGRIAFRFGGLGKGFIKLAHYRNFSWKAPLDSNLADLVFRMEGTELKTIRGPSPVPVKKPADKRMVHLQFQPPVGSPPFSGEVAISVDSNVVLHKAENNHLSLEAPVASRLEVMAGGVIGYTFETLRSKVEAAPEPLTLAVPLRAAGAVSGDILWPDPSASTGPGEAVEIELWLHDDRDVRWQMMENQAGRLVQVADDGRRYFISPVALGETYRVFMKKGSIFAESHEFKIDEGNLLARADFKQSRGESVKGRITLPDGSAYHDGTVLLCYEEKGRWISARLETSAEGKFESPHVNFAMDGTYYLGVPPGRGCAPLIHKLKGGVAGLNLHLEPGKTLGVRILNEDGNPAVGVGAYAIPLPDTEHYGMYYCFGSIRGDNPSDNEGIVRFTTLPDARFRLGIEWDHGIATGDDREREFRIPEDAGRELTLKMKQR